jgi:16S rRNA (cytidine1402-2'-O)-methyltransferase
MASKEKGTLFVVATPMGNLKDISVRALGVLRESDLIAAEDTRRTQKLLAAYDIHTPLTSYHENNKFRKTPFLLRRLQEGHSISLVTDGGTPGISDPGSALVKEARAALVPVIPVPGASALTCALSASGLPGDSFIFLGFLPKRKSRRHKILEELKDQKRTIIFYEAPHRIADLLMEIKAVLGNREGVLTRELTKMHEEILTGTLEDLIKEVTERGPKGEYCFLLAPLKKNEVFEEPID